MKDALTVTARPEVDASSIDAALGKARELKSTLDGVGGSAAKAAGAIGRQAGRMRRDALLSDTA